jgi:hypothetical protein
MRIFGQYSAEMHGGWEIKSKHNSNVLFWAFLPAWIIDNAIVVKYMPEPSGG